MKVLVIGGTGATGRLLVRKLLEYGHSVRAIVRNRDKLRQAVPESGKLDIIQAELMQLKPEQMAEYVRGCGAIASCLGHNLTLRGLFGPPHQLVTEAVRNLCRAVGKHEPETPVRFVLMNTTGNRNRDIQERASAAERAVTGLVRVLLPPQRDNERAAGYLSRDIGQDSSIIQWAAVRPDNLINETEVSGYTIHSSPVRSPIFDPGRTSRINVADFMARLITEDDLWQEWKGRMPVIYNKEE